MNGDLAKSDISSITYGKQTSPALNKGVMLVGCHLHGTNHIALPNLGTLRFFSDTPNSVVFLLVADSWRVFPSEPQPLS